MVRNLPFFLLPFLLVSWAAAGTPSGSARLHELAFERFEMQQVSLAGALRNAAASSVFGESAAFSPSLQDSKGSELKSRKLAFLRSLLLPGWGQHYAGSKSMMRVFIASEVLLWGSFLGFETWSNRLEDDYRVYATQHANIDPHGKRFDFFVDIGNYGSLEEYNQAQLRERDVADLYPTETDDFYWRWDTDLNRQEFERLRIGSDRAANRAEFVVAAIFVNHFFSAVHSTFAAFKHNKKIDSARLEYGLHFDGDSRGKPSLTFRMRKQF